MLAAIVDSDTGAVHAVYWTGRQRLSVKCVTYCGETLDGGDGGVLQLPDDNGVCSECRDAIKHRAFPRLKR